MVSHGWIWFDKGDDVYKGHSFLQSPRHWHSWNMSWAYIIILWLDLLGYMWCSYGLTVVRSNWLLGLCLQLGLSQEIFYIMVIFMHFNWFFKRVGNNSCTKKSKHVMDCPTASSEMSHPCPHITSNLLVWRIHLARESHLTLGCQWNWKFKCNTMMMTCNPIAGLIEINHLPLFPYQWTWTFHPPY